MSLTPSSLQELASHEGGDRLVVLADHLADSEAELAPILARAGSRAFVISDREQFDRFGVRRVPLEPVHDRTYPMDRVVASARRTNPDFLVLDGVQEEALPLLELLDATLTGCTVLLRLS